MTTPDYRSPTAENGRDTSAKDQVSQTAGTAADQGKHVADVAKDEAKQVTTEAKQQARNLVSEARTQIEDQSRSQRDRLVSTLRTLSDDLEQMSSQSEGGMASDLVHQGAAKMRGLTDNIAGREPGELLDEARDFARRRPGAFLLGALAAGVVAGRLARGAKDAGNGSAAEASAYDDLRGVPGGSPVTADRPVPPAPVVAPTSVPEAGRGVGADPLGGTPPVAPGQPWTNDPARRGTA